MDFGALEGRRIGRYEVLARLASGGMGSVYLARLGGIGGFQRLYAVKQLHPHLAESREFINMFLDEARLAAKIHHPHVVSILEVGEEVTAPNSRGVSSPGYFVAMEYVEGATSGRLASRARRTGGLPVGIAVRITLDALEGLDCAHELVDDDGRALSLVHRDVSPDNILVGVDGLARLTDFGVARAAERVHHSASGELKGKLSYMAPEQAQGRPVDRRADIFAMGVVLWELLTDARLFKSANDADTLRRLLYEPIPRARQQRTTVALELDEVCATALARDPAERYATARDFGSALERAAAACGVTAGHRDVAALVAELMNREISERREYVRALARSSRTVATDARPPGEPDSEDLARAETVAASIDPPSFHSGASLPLGEPLQHGGTSVSAAMAVPSNPKTVPPLASPEAVKRPHSSRRRLTDAALAFGIVVFGGLAVWRATSTLTGTHATPGASEALSASAFEATPAFPATSGPPPANAVPQAEPAPAQPLSSLADRVDAGVTGAAPGATAPSTSSPQGGAAKALPPNRQRPSTGKARGDKNADFGDRL